MKSNPFSIIMIVAAYVMLCLTHAKVKAIASDVRDIKAAICAEKEAVK